MDIHFNLDLTGAIPHSLAQLSMLWEFNIWATSVCVPADGNLEAWLHTVSAFRTSELGCNGLSQVLFSASRYEVREGGTVALTVRWIDQSEVPIPSATIDLTVLPGGRATGSDYAGVPESVTITAPSTEATFVIEAIEDNHFDDGETLVLGFGQPLPSGTALGNEHGSYCV